MSDQQTCACDQCPPSRGCGQNATTGSQCCCGFDPVAGKTGHASFGEAFTGAVSGIADAVN